MRQTSRENLSSQHLLRNVFHRNNPRVHHRCGELGSSERTTECFNQRVDIQEYKDKGCDVCLHFHKLSRCYFLASQIISQVCYFLASQIISQVLPAFLSHSEALVVYYTCIITRHPYHVLSHNGLQALEESTFSPLRKKRWGTWARAHVSHKHPPSMSPALCDTWIAIAFPYRVRLYFPVHLLSRRLMKSCLSRGNVDDINYDLSLELLVLFSTTYL